MEADDNKSYGGFEEDDGDATFGAGHFIRPREEDASEAEGRNEDSFPDEEATVSGNVKEEEIDRVWNFIRQLIIFWLVFHLGLGDTILSLLNVVFNILAKYFLDQQLSMAVDPVVMEYLTSTSHYDQIKKALAAQKSEIHWKPNDEIAVIVYRGDIKSNSWLLKCFETGKKYVKLTIHVCKERLILLKKIKFVEKLQENKKELVIKLDTEAKQIYFEGLPPQFIEVIMKFYRLHLDIVENNLKVSKSILEVLSTDEGLKRVKCELEKNNVEAVFVIDNKARIVGTSVAHVEQAASLVRKLTMKEKVRVDDKSQHLLKTAEWHQLCEKLNSEGVVRVYRHESGDTDVAGFREDMLEAMKRLDDFVERNRIWQEQFHCSSKLMRRYLSEFLQDDLRCIETELANFEVVIQNGKADDNFAISGKKEGLTQVEMKLCSLQSGTMSETFLVEQPGLRKFFSSGEGDRLIKSVENDHTGLIDVQTSFDRGLGDKRTPHTEAASENDFSSREYNDEDDEEAVVYNSLITSRAGHIECEEADMLVTSGGACSQGIVNAGGQAMSQNIADPSTGDIKKTGFSIEVIYGDLTQETTDAIINIISTDMNMGNAGELSKAILRVGGSQIQQECSQLGQQSPGSAVMTSGGSLAVPRVIHIIPGSSDKQHLQTCLEAGLRLADRHKLRSISIPCVGTGGFGLAAVDSAEITFRTLGNFSANCKSVRKVHVIVFQASMMQEFLQAQKRQAVKQDEDQPGRNLPSEGMPARQSRNRPSKLNTSNILSNDLFVKIEVIGKDRESVKKAVDSLKKGFSKDYPTQKVEDDTVSHFSQKQIHTLMKQANDRDVRLEIEPKMNRVVVRGELTEVLDMINQIWRVINKRNKKIQKEQKELVLKNIEWSFEIRGMKSTFDPETNTKIEMAYSKKQATVQVSLRGDEFVIDFESKTGIGRLSSNTIKVFRKLKGADEGISLPPHWAPSEKTVHTVRLASGSSEYQDVLCKMQATTSGLQLHVQKIERIQNPHLYQSYMVKKQKMDKDYGGNSERQLFHGTDGKNVNHINTQGFNRSFCGAHGTNYGRGVYFARDASYSVGYAGGGGGARHMYLARVLVGRYCRGHPGMIVPPPKDPFSPEILHDSVVDHLGNPSIFVVFFDNQCYPEYLITF